MKTSFLPLLGLILLNVHFSSTQLNRKPIRVEGSGSGTDIDIQPNGNKDTTTIELSGSGVEPPVTSKPSGSTTIITDDEDEEDIIFNGSGGGGTEKSTTSTTIGSGNGEIEGSGAVADVETIITTPKLEPILSENKACAGSYCWCLDKDGKEIQGTITYIGDSPLDCSVYMTTTISTTNAPSSTTSTTARPTEDTTVANVVEEKPSQVTDAAEVIEEPRVETTTKKAVVTVGTTKKPAAPSSLPPYVINNGGNSDITPKFDPATPKNPSLDGSGNSDGRKGDGDVEKEPAGALFTHPGILAIIIGGGIVALLSALLLIMFIVYRMRKKDEGSYPLDADSKPPRFQNTYSNTNKEFYL